MKSLMLLAALAVSGAMAAPFKALPPFSTRVDAAGSVYWSVANGRHDRLLVYLGGTNEDEEVPNAFIASALSHGYPVLSVRYDNVVSVAEECFGRDPGCYGRVRERKAIGGSRRSADDAQPIEEAIKDAIDWLQMEAPRSLGGTTLLSNNRLRWDRLMLSGHSQGAGMAAYLAQRYDVAAVMLLSGPWDGIRGGRTGSGASAEGSPAPWLHGTSRTRADRWYAGYHMDEQGAEDIRRGLRLLHVDARHIYESHVRVKGVRPHSATVMDGATGDALFNLLDKK